MKNFAIAVHGGAGTILRSMMNAEKEATYRSGLNDALDAGYQVLHTGGSALDAVCAAVEQLENFPLFNAGKGAVFNSLGSHELDASLMWGKDKSAGAVCGVSRIKNPILLSRLVMDQSEHVMLCGAGAEEFAKAKGMEWVTNDYFHTEQRYQDWLKIRGTEQTALDHSSNLAGQKKFGTVGAVALDQNGNLAAATSTGGISNKKFGRVGDTPIIGSGTYANNNSCAISCTGHGEFFIRSVVAYDISCLMEYKGLSLKEACEVVVHDKLVKIGGEGGLIAIDALGNIEMPFNSEGMYRGFRKNEEPAVISIYRD